MSDVRKTDLSGVRNAFPELQEDKNWWPIIPKDNADYFILFKDQKPLCFAGVVFKNNRCCEIQGLYASKKHRDPTAVFELMDWIGFRLMDYDIKIYVINDTALWGWKRIGFKVVKSKKMKYWTAYWIERRAINGTTEN